MTRPPATRPRPSPPTCLWPSARLWLAALVVLGALLAACSTRVGSFDAPVSDEVRRFRETHVECNPRMFQVPCQIGPDGKLYRYNPGETDQDR